MRSLKVLCGLAAITLALGLVGRGTVGAATSTADDLRLAFQSALDVYVVRTDPQADLVLREVRTGKGWAYAVAQPRELPKGATHPEHVVLLAREARTGWDVLTPLPDDLAAYNARLDALPETLLSAATKAFVRPLELGRAAPFSGHLFPWPVGKYASVGRTDVAPSHIGQADFGVANSIYATKSGKVVFVKEITPDDNTGHCGDMSCWTQANMVVIQHGPSEYSWYVHVKQNSVPVNVGTWVNVGTKVGEKGWNGYSTAPHLHYMTSTGATAWTNPADRYAAPWGTGIAAVDFIESPWTSLAIGQSYRSQNASDPGVAATAVGRYDLFVRGENNDVYRSIYQGGTWGAWAALQAVGTSGVDAVARGNSDVDVYVRGLGNEVWHRQTNGGVWSNWLSLSFPTGAATGDPGAAWKGGLDVDVFTRGDNNALYSRYINLAGWTLRDGVLTGGADAYYCGNSRTVVTLRGVDRVWARTITGLNGAVSYGAWEDLGNPNGVFATSDPTVVCTTTSTDVFVRGNDKQLYQKTKTGASWPAAWTPRGGFLTSGPDATSWGAGHMAVFVRGDTGAVFNLTFTNGVPGAWGPFGGVTTP